MMKTLKLDILAIGVHPDDAELGCGGTIINQVTQGNAVGVLDLTKGELGTRGSSTLRLEEAQNAAGILGLKKRVNLNMKDGFFQNNEENKLAIIKWLRFFKPDIVLANTPQDRHPDHGRASKMIYEACFLSGLLKIETTFNDEKQEQWRPKRLLYYIQDWQLKPDLIVDITDSFEKKMEAVLAYKSQFYDPNSILPATPISDKEFIHFLESRARNFGRMIGTKFAEGFITDQPIGTDDLFKII